MEPVLPPENIPKGLQESLARISSEKVRLSFLELLKNAGDRNTSNHNSL